MARSQHPPLPSAVRPLYWVLRVAGTLIGVAGLAIVAIAVSRDLWQSEFIPIVVASLAFAMLAWIHPLSRWFVPVLVVCGLLVMVSISSWGIKLLIAGTLAFVAWGRRPGRRIKSQVDAARISITDPTAAMRRARTFVEAFEDVGFTQVGALQIPIGPINVIASLLLSPDCRSYASVTDAVMSVTSLFPEDRSLITRNSALVPDPSYALTNASPGASPSELATAHSQALALLGQSGHFPITIAAPELPQIALDGERRSIEWIDRDRPIASKAAQGLLTDRIDHAELIDRWYAGSAS